eukprot:1558281-Rhodomonas_salina.2
MFFAYAQSLSTSDRWTLEPWLLPSTKERRTAIETTQLASEVAAQQLHSLLMIAVHDFLSPASGQNSG